MLEDVSGQDAVAPCPACKGDGVTEHEEHTVVTDPDGTQREVVHRFTGACSTCHGSGLG